MGLMLLPVGQWLDEARRVVRPGGRLVATMPATGPLTGGDRLAYGRLLVALRLTGLRYPGDPAMRNLGRLMPAAGFTVVFDRRLTPAEEDRWRACRPVFACFWPMMLMPGNPGFVLNPGGSLQDQARHVMTLLHGDRG